jgi:AICAR transformylase/IMP cyclohydrolase PurH
MQGGSIASVKVVVVSVVGSSRQCAVQAVSGAAVVQEETSTGADSRMMRVVTGEKSQSDMLSLLTVEGE